MEFHGFTMSNVENFPELGLSQMIIIVQKSNSLSRGKGPLYSTRSCLRISVFLSLILL